jgi:hypothetical protein
MSVERHCSSHRSKSIEQDRAGGGTQAFKPPVQAADHEPMEGFMRVSVGIETTTEEVDALERVFRLAEIPVLVDDEIARFSDDSPWIMYVSAPMSWFSSRFARVAADAPAEQLGPGLAAFVDQVSGVFVGRSGSILFTDEGSEVVVALTPELPEAAFGALLRVDFVKVEGERISWEEEHKAWYTLRGEPCPIT